MNATVMLGALSPGLSLFVGSVLVLLLVGPLVFGAVLIQERQVGIIVKRFGTRALPPGRFIALAGEAGYQAETLAPGLHFGYWRWQYRMIKGVNIAELKANANVKQATGDAEATRLRALGEAEAIRATGQAKAEAYLAGVEALGAQGYTVMQLMQIVGERNVRIVPDVAVSGTNGSTGLVDGLLGVLLHNQSAKPGAKVN